MFYFSGCASDDLHRQIIAVYAIEFPHSVIPGSKLARQLPEAYRSHATTFIAPTSQGIHHTPLVLLRLVSKRHRRLTKIVTTKFLAPCPAKRDYGVLQFLQLLTTLFQNSR